MRSSLCENVLKKVPAISSSLVRLPRRGNALQFEVGRPRLAVIRRARVPDLQQNSPLPSHRMYETFAHTADLGLRVRAPTREALFADAARGLFSMLVINLQDVQPEQEVQIELSEEDAELLLFDWLTELLFRFETKHLLLRDFEVTFRDGALRARCYGEPMDPARHQMDHEVKAITYHGLRVERDSGGWLAEVIVDI
jgi:SHS2 domain-containing protein